MLVQLEARGFRNLEPLSWRPGPGRHLLLGDNGAGKTSLIEAVYVLATTRSFRTSRLADGRRHGGGFFALAGEVEGPRRVRLEVGWGEEGRRRSVNGAIGPLAEHLDALPVVAWTAADAEILTGAPELRRRLLDRGVLGLKPAALDALSRFRRALAQKRSLLARGGGADLEPWNEILAEAAAEVIALRARYAGALAEALTGVVEAAGLPYPAPELVYRPSPAAGLDGAGAVVAALARAAGAERRRGQPLVGPHRDDVEVRWRERELRGVASAGERKAFAVALAAAQGKVLTAAGREPLYLLDDLDAELSEATLATVWRAFGDAGQLLATSNRPGAWEGLDATTRWWLQRGRLEALRAGVRTGP